MNLRNWLLFLIFVAVAGTAVFMQQNKTNSVQNDMAVETAVTTQDPNGPESICGNTDNRALSSDNRVGRLSFVSSVDDDGNPTISNACTAWIISNGLVLTAGHCVDWDPDGFGPMLPDGNLDIDDNDLVEFNPPSSTSAGNLQPAPPERRYNIDLDSVQWAFSGEGEGYGNDWAVMRLLPNAVTGELASNVQGGFRVTDAFPDINTTVRITGHGSDTTPDNSRNRVQQTHSGPLTWNADAFNTYLTYQVDTTGGNSGSPVIWEANQYTLGIHTNAGCGATSGSNAGTAFNNLLLQLVMSTAVNDMQAYEATATIHADPATMFPVSQDGSIFRPRGSLMLAYGEANAGNKISLMAGDYNNESLILSKELLVVAPVGSAVIGK